MDVGFGAPQSDGLSVGNEVNFVVSLRQFQSQFSGHYATAAIGWITGDSDFHARPIFMCGSSPGRLEIRWLEQAVDADFTRVFGAEAAGEGRLQTVFRPESIAGINLVQVRLKLLLRFFWKSSELDSHADAGIAGTNYSTRRDPLFSHPEIDA
jgi:hypothetical protein